MTKHILDVNKKYSNKSGMEFSILKINNHKDVSIKFDSGYVVSTTAGNIVKGNIKDRLSPSVYGVGISDIYSSDCKHIYTIWRCMLKRCYSSIWHEKYPTYKDCYVCDEWKTFSKFKKWMISKDYENKELDKDVLNHGNKEYAPDKCVFVNSEVNSIIIDTYKNRGKYKQGVNFSKLKNKYQSSVSKCGKRFHIGTYETESEAYCAYLREKSKHVRSVANLQTNDIRDGLYRYADILDKKVLHEEILCSN